MSSKREDPVYAPHNGIVNSTVSGLTEAPRGALGHWVTLSLGKIKNYQVITPTCWNASPRDNVGLPGPIEKALVGTPVLNIEEPIEVLRVIHSFDPCLACAVHVARPAEGKKIYAIGDSEDRVKTSRNQKSLLPVLETYSYVTMASEFTRLKLSKKIRSKISLPWRLAALFSIPSIFWRLPIRFF